VIFLSKIWPFISLVIITGLIMLLFRGGCSGPSHTGDKNIVDSSGAAYKAYKAAAETRIARLQYDSAVKERKIDTLLAEKLDADTDLVNRGAIIGRTLNDYHGGVAIHDTLKILVACDSLAGEVEAGKVAVHGYRILTDSLVAAYVEQGKIKDSTAQAWRSLFLHADTANAIARQKYASLYSDYVKQSSKLKFTTKAGAVAIIVILATSLLKK